MWDMIKVGASESNLVSEYLVNGYEPFAVSVDMYGTETVWMKKEIPYIEPVVVDGISLIHYKTKEEMADEIHSQ